MINSLKHSRESNIFASSVLKNFEHQEVNDDMEVFDLLRMTSDIEKIFCEAEENFEQNFEKLEEAGEPSDELAIKSCGYVGDANSNNSSLLANGNIWQDNNENGDDSLILAEKFEKLKKTRSKRKNKKNSSQMQFVSEDCLSIGNQYIFDNVNRNINFSNLKQSKFFQKETASPSNPNYLENRYHIYEEADFSNLDEISSIKNFGHKIFNFVPEKKLISSPQSISTNLSETGNTDKSRRSTLDMNLQEMTPSHTPNSQTFINHNNYNFPQNFLSLSRKKLKFEAVTDNDFETDSVPKYSIYPINNNFLMKNCEELDSTQSHNCRNYQYITNKYDNNFDEGNCEAVSSNGELINNNIAYDSNNNINKTNINNTPITLINNQYDYSNLSYIHNYNKYTNENVESSPNFKINKMAPNFSLNDNYYNYNYCKYFIEENSKKMNLIKSDNNNINTSNMGYSNSNNNSNNFNSYNISINNISQASNTPKKSNENTPISAKLSYKERKKDIKSNKREKNGDDENNKIILENIIKRKDKRTTIMIKNIPNKYTLKSLVEDLNVELKGKYDLLYLPLDYVNNCNLGFAFINFVESFHIILFFELFRGKKWKRFNSEKICELAYAKIQGKSDLITHFEKGTVLNFESKDKKPLIMNTPSPLPKITVLDMFIKYHPWSNLEVSGERFLINSFNGF